MSTSKTSAKAKDTSRKLIRKEIAAKLDNTLVDLKAVLGEKKFGSRIKKAAKKLSAGIKIKAEKKPAKKAKDISKKKIKIVPAVEAVK